MTRSMGAGAKPVTASNDDKVSSSGLVQSAHLKLREDVK